MPGPTYAEMLAALRERVREVTPEEVRDALAAGRPVRLVDVREGHEWAGGHLAGAAHVPLAALQERIAEAVPGRDAEVVLYCKVGERSLFAAQALGAMGYRNAASMAGGIVRWRELGLAVVRPSRLTDEQRERYGRHLLLPEVGEEGQERLLAAKVLLVGAGGLGSPIALYLAGAGVGTLGVVDSDAVDLSNLHRQVLHSTRTLGRPKTESAALAIGALNPDVRVIAFPERLGRENALRILEGFDVVVDGGDNFPTRYLLNDACLLLGKPLVHGSVHRFEGQVTTFWPGRGPCYRCLFPAPPEPELAPSCAQVGVLGVLPGVVGLLQANEVVKIVLGRGETLVGRLLAYDALETRFRELRVRPDPECPACRPGARPELVDYEAFCAGGR
ncbi:MAG TPA: molybdopterin-synthase adenylyltransferase MoeB [Anaeromyxobacteraceae bacterium]|nr:molybdopterin-synthase adenylyltransferase MoeB [Anaeromyxobacteraceae bacterium]